MKKIISIIIATFNSEKTLEKCLNSIIKQKDNSIEIIIIDGSSTDQTKKIIENYSKHIDYVISELDDGIYDAWNKGIKVSSGQWIMFVGSDDELRDECISTYKKQILDHRYYDYICGRIMFVNSKGIKLQEFGQPYDWSRFKTIMNLAHVSALHNRRLFDKLGHYDTTFKICGDYEFLLRKKNKLKVKFIDEIFANMLIGGISYNSFDGIKETKNAKLKHKVKSNLLIIFDYNFSLFKLTLKKLILHLGFYKNYKHIKKF